MLDEYVYTSVRETVDTMMGDRGYAKLQDAESGSAIYERKSDKDTAIFFLVKPTNLNQSEGVDSLKDLVKTMEKQKINHSIIATYAGFTPNAVEHVESIKARNYIELFEFHELMFPVVEHCTQQKYSLMEEEDVEKLFKELAITEQTKRYILPRMAITDPVARYYDYKSDQIISIERTGDEQYIRIVF